MFDELKEEVLQKNNKIEQISGALVIKNPVKNKTFEKSSIQKAEVYLEPMRASTMKIFVNIPNGFIFSQCKLHHRSSTRLFIGL